MATSIIERRNGVLVIDCSQPRRFRSDPCFAHHRDGFVRKLGALQGGEIMEYHHPKGARQSIQHYVNQQRYRLRKPFRFAPWPEKGERCFRIWVSPENPRLWRAREDRGYSVGLKKLRRPKEGLKTAGYIAEIVKRGPRKVS
jgi:hypothetical protein